MKASKVLSKEVWFCNLRSYRESDEVQWQENAS
jgi:hypothetical protein